MSARTIPIHPMVRYPRVVQTGRTYLLTVDLEHHLNPDQWPYDQEEYPLTCLLESLPYFEHQPQGDPALIIHRFGGTYGEVRFAIKAAEQIGEGHLRLLFVNSFGVPVHVAELSGIQIQNERIASVEYAQPSRRSEGDFAAPSRENRDERAASLPPEGGPAIPKGDAALIFAFNGIDGTTGEPLYPPASLGEMDALARGVRPDPRETAEATAWKERVTRPARRQTAQVMEPVRRPHVGGLGLRGNVDALNLASSGWGVVFPQTVRPEIREALAPLIEHRKRQAAARFEWRFRELSGDNGYRAGDSKPAFLRRLGVGPGPADPDRCPYYLLLVGSPEEIPWSFQHQLDVGYAVGRLYFDTAEEYASYAETVIAAETGRISRPRRLTLFGTRHSGDRTTELMADHLISHLAASLASSYPVETILASEATKERLARALGGDETPALLFTAMHGVCFPAGDPQQRARQGALLCQDWPGDQSPVEPDAYLAGDDIATSACPAGLIAFFYGCHSMGTPRHDAFPQRDLPRGRISVHKKRRILAPQPFAARLPQRLLGHPSGGALAVIGHVERTWGYSFLWEGVGGQTQVFEDTLERLLEGYPVGHALEPFALRLGELAEDLTSLQEAQSFGEPVDPQELVCLWTAHNDVRAYALLGDPAVRLPPEQGPTRIP